MRKRIQALVLAVVMTFGVGLPVVAHTVSAHSHTHSTKVADGGGWYHTSQRGSCSGGWEQTYHQHYTWFAAKQIFVYQHASSSYKTC